MFLLPLLLPLLLLTTFSIIIIIIIIITNANKHVIHSQEILLLLVKFAITIFRQAISYVVVGDGGWHCNSIATHFTED